MTNLDKANIGEIWKDRHDIVWQVSGVCEKNKPKIIFFERPSEDLKTASIDTVAFSVDPGWEMILAPEHKHE